MQTYARRAVILIYLSTFPTYVTTGFSGAIEYSWGLFYGLVYNSSAQPHSYSPAKYMARRVYVYAIKKSRYK